LIPPGIAHQELPSYLDMAKRMLRSGDKPVTTIALDREFNSSSYFSHCFLRAFNTSPSQFKKSIQTA
jgi:AraC-like DNA-binding protein